MSTIKKIISVVILSLSVCLVGCVGLNIKFIQQPEEMFIALLKNYQVKRVTDNLSGFSIFRFFSSPTKIYNLVAWLPDSKSFIYSLQDKGCWQESPDLDYTNSCNEKWFIYNTNIQSEKVIDWPAQRNSENLSLTGYNQDNNSLLFYEQNLAYDLKSEQWQELADDSSLAESGINNIEPDWFTNDAGDWCLKAIQDDSICFQYAAVINIKQSLLAPNKASIILLYRDVDGLSAVFLVDKSN